MKLALIIIDMLNDYFQDGRLKENRVNLSKNINALVDWARDSNIPIVWVRQEFEPDLSDAFPIMQKKNIRITIKGTGGEKVISELHKVSSDYEIIKKRYSPFFKTDFEKLLSKLETDTLILTGINTHACIRMTAIDAYQRDYKVIIAEESIDSYDPEHHRVTLEYLHNRIAEVFSNEEIKSMFN